MRLKISNIKSPFKCGFNFQRHFTRNMVVTQVKTIDIYIKLDIISVLKINKGEFKNERNYFRASSIC